MTTPLTLTLGAPSHAVEPALLAQRLPTLTSLLHDFAASPATPAPTATAPAALLVHAARLGVQRDHVTLEALPTIAGADRAALIALATTLANEFAAEGLAFVAASETENVPHLGRLNRELALPPAANFIGRDIAKALPRSDEARVLRQFVNAAQMTLHQLPLTGGAVNSVWCSAALPSDSLSQTWLQFGLTAWWDALPAWDAALEASALAGATRLELTFSDVTLSVPLKRLAAWALWAKPLDLAAVLQANHG